MFLLFISGVRQTNELALDLRVAVLHSDWLSVIILLLVVVVFYIFALLFIKESPEIKCISLALSVVIILYLLIDTHLIMSRQSLKLESNEIVFAVLTLHLDGLTLLADELTNCPSNCGSHF